MLTRSAMKRRCDRCKFWSTMGEPHDMGLCRRYAPAATLVAGSPTSEEPDEFHVTWWPETHDSDGCFDFKKKKKARPYDLKKKGS